MRRGPAHACARDRLLGAGPSRGFSLVSLFSSVFFAFFMRLTRATNHPGLSFTPPPHPPPMSSRPCLIALLPTGLALALLARVAPAAAAESRSATSANAAVSGRVKNVATDQYLGKAQVSVKGTDIVA